VFLPAPIRKGWRHLVARPESTRALVDASTRVIAGNEYLAAWARETHDRVEVIPTVVDTDVFRPRTTVDPEAIPLVGWIGAPSATQYLEPLLPILDDLGRSFRFRLLVVGAKGPIRLQNVEVLSPPWSAATEPELFRSLDIGVYPLADDRWALCKCGFKAIEYMASGVPSVASPVGVVTDIVRPEVDGLWAKSPSEWRDGLASLLGSPDLRHTMARAARERAVTTWSLTAVAPRFIQALEKSTSNGAR
jgi:glycosyltransferase involved in cell wall biosynthesis